MSKPLEYLGIAAFVGLLGLWGYHEFIEKPAKRTHGKLVPITERSARFDAWAYVAKAKEVAPGETIKLVIIPSPFGIDELDMKCLIYTNQNTHTSQMLCPDANQMDLAETEI
jgi:hypothetical protein